MITIVQNVYLHYVNIYDLIVNLPKFEADLPIDVKMGLINVSGYVSRHHNVLGDTYYIYLKWFSFQ